MNSIIFDNWLNVSSKSFNKGIHFGQKSIRLAKTNFWHPLMSDYFLGIRQNVSVLNTQQTLKSLLRAFHIIALILNKKGRILIINTNPEFFRLCNNLTNITLIGKYKFFIEKKNKKNYKKLKTPLVSYVSYKWIGGTLTNWKQISKSVLTFAKFSERCEHFLLKNGIDFPKYSRVKKCFQGLLYKENNKMLLAFKQKPDLIFLINPNENRTILNEAYRLHIPVIAFTESSTDPKEITYPIPVNNYSIKFIYFCLKKIIKMTHFK
uniref:30S ribosomal protein S2 n=2 Tax=Chlorella TaxID=3071 RepID=A0A097P5W6_CHLVA|nr:30S ribosomal protein S2 [Chlorella variabilis]AIU38964.1 30S ribosomal protein S2 [Chlorella variabilis]AJP09423.1 30S ribosomal protein S2 [Chlorella variabilis]AST08884.1 30S ribosomal protein S2 [Chlorella sp. ATCC 30562]